MSGNSTSEEYQTCPGYGRDCEPEPFETVDRLRVAFSRPEHGPSNRGGPFDDGTVDLK